MSNVIWKGGAAAVAQVTTCTVGGTIETDDIFKITIGTKTLSVTAGSTVAATVATTIAAAFNALSATEYPEFAEITALATAGGALTLTADTAGVPFTVTLATTEAGGGAADAQTWGQTATTASAGPNDWSTAGNWSGGAVPVNSDDVYLEDSAIGIYYGLDQSAVTLTSLTIRSTFIGTIGLPRTNANGYVEYRDTYLKIGATTINAGQGDGSGSGRIKINCGTVQTTLNLDGTGAPYETGVPSLLFLGTHASNAINVTGGEIGIAFYGGEVSTVSTLKVTSAGGSTPTVVCGLGVTLGTLLNYGGNVRVDATTAAITLVTQYDGSLTIDGKTNACTALTVYGGTVFYNSSGTCTTATVGSNGTLDFRQDMRAKTVTNMNAYNGAAVYDTVAVVTFTNGLDLIGCGIEDVTLELGKHRTWTPSTI